MPPLPKRKTSKARKGSRAAHTHATLPHLTDCPHCHQPTLSHQVCPSCGYYRGRDILRVETEIT